MALLLIISVLGFGFIGLLPKSFPHYIRLITAPAIGLLVFTTLTLYLSFLTGFETLTIVMSVAITVILSFISLIKFRASLEFDNISKIFIFSSFLALAVFSYLSISQTLFMSFEGIESGGGGLYGDSALHAAYTSRLETGEFPPRNPLFAGKTLVYPFANDLLSATLKKFGANLNLAFTWPQILFFVSFLSLFYQLVRKFTKDKGFVIALLLLMFGWGIGAVFFLKEFLVGTSNLSGTVARDYTNYPEYNLHLHNIITGLILPERSFLPGLVIGLLIFLFVTNYIKYRKLNSLLLSGFLLGILPFWHTHTFIYFLIFSIIIGSWLILETKSGKVIRDFFSMALIALLIALPFLILFLSNHNLNSFLRITAGWQAGEENLILFWFKNSFLIIPLTILGFFTVQKISRVYFVPAVASFLIANILIFQPWEWDNIKLLSWSFLFFSILSAVTLVKIFEKNLTYKLLVVFIILLSSASGILSISLQFKNKFLIYDKNDIALADWAKANTDVDDIFLINPRPNHPIPGLAGRLVYIGYPGHLWVHGIDYASREVENELVLNGDFNKLKDISLPASYIVLPQDKNYLEIPETIKVIFNNEKYLVLENRADFN